MMSAPGGGSPTPVPDAMAGAREEPPGSGRNQAPLLLPPEPMRPPVPFAAPEPMLPPEPMQPPPPFLAPGPMLPPGPMPVQGTTPPSAPPAATALAAVSAPAAGAPPAARPPWATDAPVVGRPEPAARPEAQPGPMVPPVRAPAPWREPRPRARPPGRSGRRARLLALLAGAAVLVLAASLKTVFSAPASPVPAAQHSMPAARGGTPGGGGASSAPVPQASGGASSAPVPQTRDERWLNGLSSLQQQMNDAIQNGVITPASLRREAATLRRCTPELTALGPPGHLLRPTYRLARQACDAFALGAKFDVAAARAYTTAGPTTGPGAKLERLLNQSVEAFNSGSALMGDAVAGAPLPPGS